jgi:hypothetical protein
MRSDGFGSFEGMDGKGGTKPSIDADLDTMRDVYMLPSQQAAFDRLATALRALRDAPVVTVNELRRDCRDELHIIAAGDNLQSVTGLLFERVALVPLDTTAGVDRG